MSSQNFTNKSFTKITPKNLKETFKSGFKIKINGNILKEKNQKSLMQALQRTIYKQNNIKISMDGRGKKTSSSSFAQDTLYGIPSKKERNSIQRSRGRVYIYL